MDRAEPDVLAVQNSFLHRAQSDLDYLHAKGREHPPWHTCFQEVQDLAGDVEALKRSTCELEEMFGVGVVDLPSHLDLAAAFEASCGGDTFHEALLPLFRRLGIDSAGDSGLTHLQEPQPRHGTRKNRRLPEAPIRRAGALNTRRLACGITAEVLLERLRNRMALRIQHWWRSRRLRCRLLAVVSSARVAETRRRLVSRLAGVLEGYRETLLRCAVRSLALQVTSAKREAATTITRLVHCWQARQHVVRQWHHHRSVLVCREVTSLRMFRIVFAGWARQARCASRWRCRSTRIMRPPLRRFWQLFPTDGKGAVAGALRDWVDRKSVV